MNIWTLRQNTKFQAGISTAQKRRFGAYEAQKVTQNIIFGRILDRFGATWRRCEGCSEAVWLPEERFRAF